MKFLNKIEKMERKKKWTQFPPGGGYKRRLKNVLIAILPALQTRLQEGEKWLIKISGKFSIIDFIIFETSIYELHSNKNGNELQQRWWIHSGEEGEISPHNLFGPQWWKGCPWSWKNFHLGSLCRKGGLWSLEGQRIIWEIQSKTTKLTKIKALPGWHC